MEAIGRYTVASACYIAMAVATRLAFHAFGYPIEPDASYWCGLIIGTLGFSIWRGVTKC